MMFQSPFGELKIGKCGAEKWHYIHYEVSVPFRGIKNRKAPGISFHARVERVSVPFRGIKNRKGQEWNSMTTKNQSFSPLSGN